MMKKRDRQYQIFAVYIILYFVSIIGYFVSIHNIDVAYNLNVVNLYSKIYGIEFIDCNNFICLDSSRIYISSIVINIASYFILLIFSMFGIIWLFRKPQKK